MPVYEYICDTCQDDFEVRRSFTDTSVPSCPVCNGSGRVRRKFSAPAIVFKGSGFYVTDSRGKNSAATPGSGKKEGGEAKTESVTPSSAPAESKANKEVAATAA
ncbi:MAG: hypothetical protein K1X65_10055 [Caldilineales bacterium]|nr:hypothetical protein [Caldilineales bacterium]